MWILAFIPTAITLFYYNQLPDIVNKKKSIQDGLIDNNISIASLTKMLMS